MSSPIPFEISQRLRVKSALMVAIRDTIEQAGQSPVQLGLNATEVESLLAGDIDQFTAESLIDIAEALNLQTIVQLVPGIPQPHIPRVA